jgi:hypothetical protein
MRHAAMVEARDKLECRYKAFKDMLRLMVDKQ